jgi:hypothetical protein
VGSEPDSHDMSFTYRIDTDAGLLLVIAEGHVTQDERLDAMKAWLSDPLFRSGLKTFCDFSNASSTPTLTELGTIVEFIQRHATSIGRPKPAVLAPKVVTFGVARHFQGMIEGEPLAVRVFTDRQAAWEWLDPEAGRQPL